MDKVKENQKTSLKYAWDKKVRKGDVREILDKMQEILNVKSDVSVYVYIRGERTPDIIEGRAIENLFREYGMEICWDCNEPELQKES